MTVQNYRIRVHEGYKCRFFEKKRPPCRKARGEKGGVVLP